jgi:hypothetical protein
MGSWKGRSIPLFVLGSTLLSGCSDAGTRVAYDIESGVQRLPAGEGASITIEHVPRSWPEGCTGPYELDIERGTATPDGQGNFRIAPDAGGLRVRCDGGGGSTTYHLRFVDVPTPLSVKKQAGERTYLVVRREHGKALLVQVR